MKADRQLRRTATAREVKLETAERTLFSTARQIQLTYGLGDADLLHLALALVDWFDPQQVGDYWQLVEHEDFGEGEMVQEGTGQ
jgi:hypothetical protein